MALYEKQITTAEYYPLMLRAQTAACSQKITYIAGQWQIMRLIDQG